MGLKQVTTNITYRVSDWHYCNLTANPKERCRFCVKDRNGYRCALYNMPLSTEETVYVVKTSDCKRALAGFKSVVKDVAEQEAEPQIDIRLVMKAAIDEYTKSRDRLLSQGYPAAIADKVAREFALGGK